MFESRLLVLLSIEQHGLIRPVAALSLSLSDLEVFFFDDRKPLPRELNRLPNLIFFPIVGGGVSHPYRLPFP